MKNFYLKTLIIALLMPAGMVAQTVTSGLTLEEYVNDILLGSGVEAFNIQLTGSDVQVGYLEDATGIPLTEGLILSSAGAENVACPDDFGTDVPFGEGVSGEPDLLTIANSVPGMIGQNFNVGSVNDVCILEFDFIATGDTVKFNYIFGSDEYLEWVNSSYNDIFAFFLSGPGINGPYADNAINIAAVPETDPALPVTVSSVNDQINSAYYIDNFNNDNICQDGYTQKLEAISPVECGETYHIKLAIADGSDTALESIVILEAGSFTSNSVVQVDLSIDVGGPDNDTMYEDCGEAILTFTRPIETVLEIEEMVIIAYGGDAENGVDYTLLPDTVVFAPGVESVSFVVDAFEDGIAEGVEWVQFEILNLAACNGGGLTSYFEFFIADEPDPLVVEGYTVEMCVGAGVEIEPIISGGYGNFVYDWSTGEDTPLIDVSPDVTTTYNVIVGDTCGMPSDDADITVEVLDLPPLSLTTNPASLVLNCGESVNIIATASGGDGVYEYSWEDEDGGSLFGFQNSLWYSTWQGADEIHVTVTDGCGFEETIIIDVTLNVPELILIQEEQITVLCNDPFTIAPEVSGGQAPFFYNWYQNGLWFDWNPSVNLTTSSDMTVTFEVQDNCGQTESVDVEITVESPAIEITLPEELVGPCTELFEVIAEISGGSGGLSYDWSIDGAAVGGNNPTLDYQTDISQTIQLYVSDACGAEDTESVNIVIDNPPVVLDVLDDINASCVDNSQIDVDVLSGSGGYQYEWFVADTSYALTENIILQSFNTVPVVVNVIDGCGSSASEDFLYIIPDIPLDIVVTQDSSICAGDGMSISALATGGEEGFYYYWPQLGEYGPDQYATPYSTQVFEVIATDICGESISSQVEVEVQFLFSNFLVEDLGDNEYQFTATPEPDCEECIYEWDFGDGNTSMEENPSHTFDGLSDYNTSLTVTNAIGCTDSTYTLINSPIILYVPNAFTPNNDGINDVFRAFGQGILGFEMIIVDRWGEVVFSSDDIETPWVGDHQSGTHYVPDGIYTYQIKVKGIDTDAYERVGQISVMR